MNYAAVDIGGTFIKYALMDERYQILEQKQVLTMALGDADAFYDYLCEEMLCEDAVLIGVCAPGIIAEDGTLMTGSSGHASIMYQTNVIKEIEQRMKLPTTVVNDAKAAGLCEWELGACRDITRGVCYLIGTGIGGCLIDKHGIVSGHHQFSGEFSYMPVWGKDGKLEQLGNHASMYSLIKQYQSIHHHESVDGKMICERFLNREEDAVLCVNHWLEAIVMQLINITAVYDPQRICIGGAVSSESWLIEELRARYQTACVSFISPMLVFDTEIMACQFHNEANLIGAVIYGVYKKKASK